MLLGQLAALGASLCFSAGSTLFTFAGRMVSAVVLNRTRLLLALVFLSAAHLLFGIPLPWDVEGDRLFWLGLSGVIGLVLGDALLFQAFVWVGPRLSMLMMSLAPILAALMGWVFLGEKLSTWQVAGIAASIGGTVLVVLDRKPGSLSTLIPARSYRLGILFGAGAALGQAAGLVTAKPGLGGDFPALSATLIRMLAAALVLWTITLLTRQAGPTLRRLRANPAAIKFILAGAFFGPTLGVTLSVFALQHIPVGVVSTLTSLPPIFLLPVGYFVFNERYGWPSIAGTFLAIAGVAVLFLV